MRSRVNSEGSLTKNWVGIPSLYAISLLERLLDSAQGKSPRQLNDPFQLDRSSSLLF